MFTTFDTSTLEERFSRGDETALPEMYRRYSAPMFATALSLLGNRDLAAEAVQQAFVQAWRAAAGFDPQRELQPWLYAITRRTAVDVYRRERRSAQHVPLDESRAGEGEFATEGPSMDAAWRAWQVRVALEQLHPDERQMLQLAYFDGFTQSEISKTLGIALGTVKSRTARAQRRLAQLLAHLPEAEDDSAQ
ncbi:RNA polymerase sigma factor [Streptomyces sp. NPDC056661]|uniref:RNA polymerase sigma factor n=1 Tax=Streptomyces sp. NPDC056661 TaxID=3345898 RepID=UPI0036BBD966